MATKNYNKVIAYIENIADKHKQIKRFASGFPSALNTLAQEDNNFPILFVEPLSNQLVSPNFNTQIFSLRVYCLDLKTTDGYNEQEVLSDCGEILNDVIKYLKLGINDSDWEYDISNFPVSQPVTNFTIENCSGWYADFDIEVGFGNNDCDIPMN